MPRSWFLRISLAFGLIFLYAPIALLVVFSFNSARSVSVWGGFSTRWYAELLGNEQLLNAAWLSLKVASVAATGAVVLGTLAGLLLARFGSFRGRAFFAGMISAPLVMPEVILGLSLLLLFVAMEQAFGWPQGRDIVTITLAHITLTMAFVTVVVQSRLVSLDASLEEAAMDLGARPAKVFFVITLPIIAPAIVSGWLLAFTLSLDDLVVAAFTSGPGSTTLPMAVFSKIRLGLDPQVNALAAFIVGVVTIGIIIATILNARAERARARDEQMAQQNG